MKIPGTYYDQASSNAIPVIVDLDAGLYLRVESPTVNRVEELKKCALSEPLGRMARHFSLPDGARIEITQIQDLADWEKETNRRSGMHLVHFFESRWRWVATAVVIMLAFTAGLYVWGLPFAAKRIAMQLPPSVSEVATSQTMDVIKRLLSFAPSTLPKTRRDKITAEFEKMVDKMDKGSVYHYRLEFFRSTIPNAFALPDGLVCITDELIKKAKDDKEIYGVLAHEIVHVRERHGIRGILQNSSVFLLWTLMTGDVHSIAGMLSALPTLLAESGYARGFETEADLGSADYMIERGWGTKPLQDILKRIDPEHSSLGGAEEAIASHPLTLKRVQMLQDREKDKAKKQ